MASVARGYRKGAWADRRASNVGNHGIYPTRKTRVSFKMRARPFQGLPPPAVPLGGTARCAALMQCAPLHRAWSVAPQISTGAKQGNPTTALTQSVDLSRYFVTPTLCAAESQHDGRPAARARWGLPRGRSRPGAGPPGAWVGLGRRFVRPGCCAMATGPLACATHAWRGRSKAAAPTPGLTDAYRCRCSPACQGPCHAAHTW